MNDDAQFVKYATDYESEYVLQLGPKATAIVIPLAAYGAQDIMRKVARKVKQIRTDHKVKKANKTTVAANNPSTE